MKCARRCMLALLLLGGLSAVFTAVAAFSPAPVWPSGAWLGVTVRAADFETLASLGLEYGVLVADAVPESPAARAGVQPGDILIELNGKPVYSVARLNWLLRSTPTPEKSSLTYFRSGRTETVDIVPDQFTPPRPPPPPWTTSGWLSASYLGVHLQAMTDELREVFGASEGEGVLIVKVMPDSPARKAALAVGDVIVRMDRKTIRQIPDVHRALTFFEPGDTVQIELIRNRRRQVLEVTLTERPGDQSPPGLWETPPYSPQSPMEPRHWQDLLEELEGIWEKLWRDLSEDRMKRGPGYL